MSSSGGLGDPVLAIAVRAGTAALVVLNPVRIVFDRELTLLRYPVRRRRAELLRAIEELAAMYGVSTVIAEPRSIRKFRIRGLTIGIEPYAIEMAGATLVGPDLAPDVQALCNHIVRRIPALAERVPFRHRDVRTSDVSLIDRRKTVILLAAALALAHLCRRQPVHP